MRSAALLPFWAKMQQVQLRRVLIAVEDEGDGLIAAVGLAEKLVFQTVALKPVDKCLCGAKHGAPPIM